MKYKLTTPTIAQIAFVAEHERLHAIYGAIYENKPRPKYLWIRVAEDFFVNKHV